MVLPEHISRCIEKLEKAGYSIRTAHLPAPDCIAGIYIEDIGVSVTVGDTENAQHIINMARFVRDDVPVGVRGTFRLASKIQRSCLDEAERYLARAAEEHFALEAIYIRAMDFDTLGRYMDETVVNIGKRLFRQ